MYLQINFPSTTPKTSRENVYSATVIIIIIIIIIIHMSLSISQTEYSFISMTHLISYLVIILYTEVK